MDIITGFTKFVAIPEMEAFPFGLMFFDDTGTVYVSPDLYNKIEKRNVNSVEYAMVHWRKSSKNIHDLVKDIVKEVISSLKEQNIPINSDLVKRLHGMDVSKLSAS